MYVCIMYFASVDDDMEMTDGGGPASKNQKNEKVYCKANLLLP